MPEATGDPAPGVDKEVIAFEGLYGLKLSTMWEGAQAYFQIRKGIKGVVVFAAIADSSGARVGLQSEDIIERISKQTVSLPSEVRTAIEPLRQAKKAGAPLFVSDPSGQTRFVTLPVMP